MSDSKAWKKAAAACAVALALLLGTVSLVWAQGAGSASITGTVKDPKGLLVPDAEVMVHNADTGADRNLTTNKDGLYVAPILQPGRYEVRVRKEGFAEVIRKDITLEVGQALTVDIDLPLKATQQTVTVTAEAGRVETEKFDVSQTIAQYQVENLPLATRRWDNLVLMTPGVAEDGYFGLVSFRGISGLYNNNMVDGADNNQAFFSETRGRTRLPYGYSIDAIKEFNVTNAAYSAEYGRAAGGVVNAVTRSGTNEYHGDGYYFIRDSVWLARDAFGNGAGLAKPDERRQFFGGGLGGPIIHDKLFFYGNYDQFKRNFPVIVTTSSGNFFNPNASTSTSGAQLANCLAGASAALAAECNAIAAALQPVFKATNPRKGNNYIGLGKIDYQYDADNRFSGVVNILRWNSPNGIQTGPTVSVSQLANGVDNVHNSFVTGSWNSVLSPSVVNEMRFQYGEDLEFQTPNASGPSFAWSSSSIGGADFGMPNFLPRTFFPDEHRYQGVDNLSWIHGRHQIKTGIDINHVEDKFLNLFNGTGSFSYSGATALQGLATDLLNQATNPACTPPTNFTGCTRSYNSFSQAGDAIFGGGGLFGTTDYNAYIQDSFKWRPSFTINFGVRYELQTVPDVVSPNPLVPATRKMNSDTNNFGPRLGFAWDIGGRQTHVLHGGYGIYYGRTQNSTIQTFLYQNGVFQKNFNLSKSTVTSRFPSLVNACLPLTPNVLFPEPNGSPAFTPIFGSSGPTPTALYPSVSAFLAACPGVAGAFATVDTLDPKFVNPLVHEWDVTYEQQLFWKLDMTVSYVGSRANHLPDFYDANLPPPNTTATYLVFDKNGNPLAPAAFTVPYFSGTVPRPNPKVGIIEEGRSIVNSWYNGLVLRLGRREYRGFSFDANFTWSHSIDDGAVQGNFGTFTGTDSPLNPFDIRSEYGPSDLNIPKRFIGNFYWVTPFGNWTSNEGLKRVIGGWKFSGVIRAQDGIPAQANMSLPSSGPNAFSCRSGDGGLTCGAISGTAGFVNGRAPFIERNSNFQLPTFFDVDFRVNREFKIKERSSIEFIWEAFNLFNRANIFGANTTAFGFVAPSSTLPSGTACPAKGTVASHPDFLGCVVQNGSYLSPTSTGNTLYGARQMQLGLRVRF